MLILGRKAGESLVINDDIVISVVAVEKGQVRLAIEAPRSVRILRSELKSAIDANRDAAQEQAAPLDLLAVLGTPPDNE